MLANLTVARELLFRWAMQVFAGIGIGGAAAVSGLACVVPIPAEVVAGDAGINHAPVIVASDPEMPLFDSAPLEIHLHPTVTISVKDNDLTDTLYVRVFRDYPDREQPVVGRIEVRTAPGNQDPVRTGIVIDTSDWCDDPVVFNKNYVFDVMVADRDFVRDFEDPLFRVNDGETSIRSWVGICRPPSP